MDLMGAFHVQATEAAAKVAVPTAEGDATKLTPSKAAAVKEFEGQGQGDGLGGDAGADSASDHGNVHCNCAALVGVDGDKACCEGGSGSCDLICPEKALATAPVAGAGGMKPKKALPLPARSSAVARKEGELPTRWPVTARPGRTPTAVYAGSTPTAAQHVSEAEKPAEVEPTSKVAMESQAPEVEQALPPEHVAVATAATEVETPAELEPVEDDVLVPVRNKNMLVSPSAKKPKKWRLDDLGQIPPRPVPSAETAEVEAPVRRIPSPASNRKHGCLRCFKEFPTHSALCGHMTYHTKASQISTGQQLEGRLAAAHALKSIMCLHYQGQGGGANFAIPSAASGKGLRGLPPPLPPPIVPFKFKCSRCSLVFGSGRSLGGHIRTHSFVEKKLWKEDGSVREAAASAAAAVAARPSAPASAAAAGPSVAALAAAAGPSAVVLAADAGPSAAAGAGPSAVPRNFDLNELPSE